MSMSALDVLTTQFLSGEIEVLDLTSPLHSETPVLSLPAQFGQTARFELEEISRYDSRGPGWYWNNFRTGEHTGTHFDAPVHWATGKDLADVSEVPPERLVGPAYVIDGTPGVENDDDYLLTVDDIKTCEAEHGPIPERAWVIYRTGWERRAGSADTFTNADDEGSHTPGIAPDAARYLADADILGLGVETVGTDAGLAPDMDPPFPCHAFLLGAGKYGLTQLRNVDQLPTTGALIVAAPLPIIGGSGSPCRVLAFVLR